MTDGTTLECLWWNVGPEKRYIKNLEKINLKIHVLHTGGPKS